MRVALGWRCLGREAWADVLSSVPAHIQAWGSHEQGVCHEREGLRKQQVRLGEAAVTQGPYSVALVHQSSSPLHPWKGYEDGALHVGDA